MDATTLLKNDHDAVREWFRAFAETGDAEARRGLYRSIRHELQTQSRVEEQIFYPAVMRLRAEPAREAVRDALEDHHVVDGLMAEIDQLEPEDALYAERCALFRRASSATWRPRSRTCSRRRGSISPTSASSGSAETWPSCGNRWRGAGGRRRLQHGRARPCVAGPDVGVGAGAAPARPRISQQGQREQRLRVRPPGVEGEPRSLDPLPQPLAGVLAADLGADLVTRGERA